MVTLTLEATDEESGMDVTPSDIMTQTYSGQSQMLSFSLELDFEFNVSYSVILIAEVPGVGMSSAELTFGKSVSHYILDFMHVRITYIASS